MIIEYVIWCCHDNNERRLQEGKSDESLKHEWYKEVV